MEIKATDFILRMNEKEAIALAKMLYSIDQVKIAEEFKEHMSNFRILLKDFYLR